MSKLGLMLKDKNKRERGLDSRNSPRPLWNWKPKPSSWTHPGVRSPRGTHRPLTAVRCPTERSDSLGTRAPPSPSLAYRWRQRPHCSRGAPLPADAIPLVDGAPRGRFSPCPLCFLLINHIYFFYFMGSLPPKWRKWKCSVIHHPVSTVIFFKKKIPTQCSAFPNHHHLVSCARFSLIMAVVLPPLLK